MTDTDYEAPEGADDKIAGVAKEHQTFFKKTIKTNIQNSHEAFKENCDNYFKWQRQIFKTMMDDKERSILTDLNKPLLEANIIESFMSRQVGEFVMHQPSILVEPDKSQIDPSAMQTAESPELCQLIDDHLRYKFQSQDENGLQVNAFTNLMSGGFSGFEIGTRYEHEMSLDHELYFIDFKKPTMYGFDPLADLSTKSDGQYCFKMHIKTKEDFQSEFSKVNIKDITFTRSPKMGEYSWSFQNQKGEKCLMVCEYYHKKKKRTKIVKITGNYVVTQKQYDETFGQKWEDAKHPFAPPAILDERWTEIETICRYMCIENQCIEYKETDFPGLPFIFMDGNSKMLREVEGAAIKQFTRPYLYQALGPQKMKNFSLQCAGAEMLNMVQHKYIMSIESVPEKQEYLEILKRPQYAGIILYNKYASDDPNRPLDPPIPVMRTPFPPEILQTFQMLDGAIQQALGSYDAALGINNNQLSGDAIVAGATQSNPAAMPYMVGYLQAYERLINMYVMMMPLYWKNAKQIPTLTKEGEKGYQKINQDGGLKLQYPKNAFKVKVSPGVNYEIQKNVTLKMIDAMMKSSQIFNEFINTMCLEDLLDNMSLRNITQMKEKAKKFTKELEQRKEEAKKQPNPIQMKAQADQARVQMEMQKAQLAAQDAKEDNQIKIAELQVKAQQIEQEKMKLLAEMDATHDDRAMKKEEMATERLAKATELAIAHAKHAHTAELEKADHMHNTTLERAQHEHQVSMDEKKLQHEFSKPQTNKG